VEPATPLLQFCGVHPDFAVEPLDTFQYIVRGTRLDFPKARFASTPLTLVVCSNDSDQLESNLLRSPCLDPGTPHELIVMREQPSAAAGFNAALERARSDLVVFVREEVYLPRGWDSQLVEQFTEAERRFGPVGVAGAYGYSVDAEGPTSLGRVIDRQRLLDMPAPLPAAATGLDEIVLVLRRDTPLRFDSSLGFHLYGADICFGACDRDLGVAVLDLPCLHNSLVSYPPPAFHASREKLLRKWPDIRPLYGSMGRLDTMEAEPVPKTWFDEVEELRARLELEQSRNAQLEAQLHGVEQHLDDRLRHIQNMEASIFWKARDSVHRLLRRN
jgi:hypothetical protein